MKRISKCNAATWIAPLLMVLPNLAQAEDLISPFDPNELRLTTGLSTFGYTLSADYRLNSSWGVRGIVGYSRFNTTVVKGGAQVVGDILGQEIYTDFPVMSQDVDTYAETGGYGLLVDYYPNLESWGSGFRVTSGAMGTLYQLHGSGTIDGEVTGIRTGESMYLHSLDGEMNIPSISPYVGLGYNHDFDEHWGISVDAGVMFNVEYDGKLSGVASNPADQARVDRILDEEMSLKLEELEPYPYLPFVFVGATYRF